MDGGPQLGEEFGGYRLVEVIARGGSGVVYLAEHTQLLRKVALKVLLPAFSEVIGPERFQHVARAAVSLGHPNIVPVYDAGEVNGQLWVAMRYIHGQSLRDRLAHGALTPRETLRILADVAYALDEVHAQGFLHLEVQPDNVLIELPSPERATERVYLTPFSLTGLILGESGAASLVGLQMVTGTLSYVAPDYASPEQFEGGALDARTDVYSLGCVLFECLAGDVPFARDSDAAVMYAHLHESPPRVTAARPELPPAIDGVIATAMSKQPADRYETCGELIRAAQTATKSTGEFPIPGYAAEPEAPMPAFPPAPPPAPDVSRIERTRVFPLPTQSAPQGAMPEGPPEFPYRAHPGRFRLPRLPRLPRPRPRRPAPAQAGRESRRPLHSKRLARMRAKSQGLLIRADAQRAAYSRRVQAWHEPGVLHMSGPHAPDSVDCAVFAPRRASPGCSILVQVFIHKPQQTDEAQSLALEFDETAARRGFTSLESLVYVGERLTFRLTAPGLIVPDPVESLVWSGRAQSVQFDARLPEKLPLGTLIATLTIEQRDLPVGHIKFKLEVVARTRRRARSEPVGEEAHRYAMAFISYASSDRNEVLRRVQTLRALGVGYFQDVLGLDPGDRWERRLYEMIDACDLFLLFWSGAAKSSEWVRREADYALQRKGDDELAPPEIRPIIIEGPPVPEPWEELRHLHFNDPLLYVGGGFRE